MEMGAKRAGRFFWRADWVRSRVVTDGSAQFVVRCVATAFLCAFTLSAAHAAAAPELPSQADAIHMGASTCGGSDCHKAARPWQNSMVQQNEFITWSEDDAHSKAYEVLLSEKGQRIAGRLGISNPQADERCLSCHTDFVPPAARGEDYSMSDGVACESCHGGARGWIGTHSTGWSTRPQNVANGMYPTDQPEARAALCLSCHQSNGSRQVDHKMYGAGHPRLVFELDTYTLSQPAHFRVDADYRARKPDGVDSFLLWRAGQLQSARHQVENIRTHLSAPTRMMPEFSVFECFVCHQPMDGVNTGARKYAVGIPRLRSASLLMVQALADAFAPGDAPALETAREALEQASQGQGALGAALDQAQAVLSAIETNTSDAQPGAETLAKLLNSIVAMGAEGYFLDYTAAEQAVTATAMVIAVGQFEQASSMQAVLDQLYATIKSEDNFRHASLRDQFVKMKTILL